MAVYLRPPFAPPTPLDQVPTYLKAVTILEPQGSAAAETRAAVDRMLEAKNAQSRDRPNLAFLVLALASAIACSLVTTYALNVLQYSFVASDAGGITILPGVIFGAAIATRTPRVAYRETIARTAEVEHRHVKQSGGPGQFAVVRMRLEPGEPGSGMYLKAGYLSYSDDGSTWTEHVTIPARSSYPEIETWYITMPASALIDAPMATLYSYSGVVAVLSAPSPTAVAYAGTKVSLSAPMATLLITVGAGADGLDAPSPTLFSLGHESSGERAAFLTAPRPTLSTLTGANAKMVASMPTMSAAGTVTGWGDVSLTTPKPTLASTGTVSGVADVPLSAPSPNLIGYSGAVCSVTLTGAAAVLATGTTGSIGGAAVTCPLFELTASATVENRGSAELLAPAAQLGQSALAYLAAPSATLVAIGHAVVTATYEAYAVNLGHQPKPGKEPVDEVTRYTNFPFTHIVRYQNSYFGANSTGLYLLEGTTDYASPTPTAIPWAFKTAMTDFKSQQHKTVASAYFGGRLGAAATVSLHVGEDGPQTYSYATVRTDHAQNYRQVFGKGTKARYYALGASGTGTMELDDIDLDVHNLTRRI